MTGSATQASMQSGTKERGQSIKNYFGTLMRRAQEMEADIEVKAAAKRRSSRGNMNMNERSVIVIDVLEGNSEIMDVCTDGPEFLDHG